MPRAHHAPVFMLAFDHRGSFERLLSVGGAAPAAQDVVAAKELIFEGMLLAITRGAPPHAAGILVDEQYGSALPLRAKERDLSVAMPAERSGQDEFDFEYGDAFGAHIEQYDPDYVKVLVRWNPDGDAALNARQAARLQQLADWLHANGRLLLFELLVPAEPRQLAAVGGDQARYDAELRPELMRRAIAELQAAGVEADLWKIEGVETRADAALLAAQARAGGRDHVVCILLGRGADDAKVEHWITTAAGVPGFVGFAIGRSIWAEPLCGHRDGTLTRGSAIEQIADRYRHFVGVWERTAAQR